jgi:hypothetical protein
VPPAVVPVDEPDAEELGVVVDEGVVGVVVAEVVGVGLVLVEEVDVDEPAVGAVVVALGAPEVLVAWDVGAPAFVAWAGVVEAPVDVVAVDRDAEDVPAAEVVPVADVAPNGCGRSPLAFSWSSICDWTVSTAAAIAAGVPFAPSCWSAPSCCNVASSLRTSAADGCERSVAISWSAIAVVVHAGH